MNRYVSTKPLSSDALLLPSQDAPDTELPTSPKSDAILRISGTMLAPNTAPTVTLTHWQVSAAT